MKFYFVLTLLVLISFFSSAQTNDNWKVIKSEAITSYFYKDLGLDSSKYRIVFDSLSGPYLKFNILLNQELFKTRNRKELRMFTQEVVDFMNWDSYQDSLVIAYTDKHKVEKGITKSLDFANSAKMSIPGAIETVLISGKSTDGYGSIDLDHANFEGFNASVEFKVNEAFEFAYVDNINITACPQVAEIYRVKQREWTKKKYGNWTDAELIDFLNKNHVLYYWGSAPLINLSEQQINYVVIAISGGIVKKQAFKIHPLGTKEVCFRFPLCPK